MNKKFALSESVAQKVLDTVDKGLCKGLGNPTPGNMCVEAAVCFAMGLPHSDNPPCVGSAVRAFKIRLNDADWPSNAARAEGMRRVAIAQLGSNELDQKEFAKRLALATIKEILPIALRAVKFEVHALACEAANTLEEAKAAAQNAQSSTPASAKSASYAAYASAKSASAKSASAKSASYAAYASAYASAAIQPCAPASKRTAAIKSVKGGVLAMSAAIAVRILVEMGCEGTKWLHLAD